MNSHGKVVVVAQACKSNAFPYEETRFFSSRIYSNLEEDLLAKGFAKNSFSAIKDPLLSGLDFSSANFVSLSGVMTFSSKLQCTQAMQQMKSIIFTKLH